MLVQRRAFRAFSVTAYRSRSFHYASSAYHDAFSPAVGAVDTEALRSAAIGAVDAGAGEDWHSAPMASFVRGTQLVGGAKVDTRNAFGAVNGSQLLASVEEMSTIMDHLTTFAPARCDLRVPVRNAEVELLSAASAGRLIANQALDFGKQDGITEIEESLQANPVEHRLNDLLFDDEAAGVLTIPRRPVFVPCVSNFSHFLDLCRKTLRSIELGVPVVVLSRTHTSQHCFRWATALASELDKQGVDPAYLTFCSATLADQQALIKAATGAANKDPNFTDAPPTPFLFTGARALAAAIKRDVTDGVIASTQGPNLMVALGLPPPVAQAAALSATIENSGQCTAMRVLVAPPADATSETLQGMFGSSAAGSTAPDFLRTREFAGLLEPPPTSTTGGEPKTPEGYTAHPSHRVAYKWTEGLPASIDEHWRQVVLDVVTPPAGEFTDDVIEGIGGWLVKHQPITVAINGVTGDTEHALPTPPVHYGIARKIFERSALCVYTVGDAGKPALTAQARPQDGETFGELPPMHELTEVTRFPMVVPSAQAAYWSYYNRDYLSKRAKEFDPARDPTALGPMVNAAGRPEAKGYLLELAEYLKTAAVGPHLTHGARTCLYGLQRPPLDGKVTALRCSELTTLDELLPALLPFVLTNARGQAVLSVDPANDTLLDELPRLQLAHSALEDVSLFLHNEAQFKEPAFQATLHRSIRPTELSATHPFPLAQQAVTRLLPLGHVKSARTDDRHFVASFEASSKWLRYDA